MYSNKIAIQFIKSCNLNLPVKIFVSSLDLPIYDNSDHESKFLVGQLYSEKQSLHQTPVMCELNRNESDIMEGSQWLEFPLCYSDCTMGTYMVLTIMTCEFKPLAMTSMYVFDRDRLLRQGLFRIEFFNPENVLPETLLPDCGYLAHDDKMVRQRLILGEVLPCDRVDQVEWLNDQSYSKMRNELNCNQHLNSEQLLSVGRRLFNRSFVLDNPPTTTLQKRMRESIDPTKYGHSFSRISLCMNILLPLHKYPVVFTQLQYPSKLMYSVCDNGWVEIENKETGYMEWSNPDQGVVTHRSPDNLVDVPATLSPLPLSPGGADTDLGYQYYKAGELEHWCDVDLVYDDAVFVENPVEDKCRELTNISERQYDPLSKPSPEQKKVLDELVRIPITGEQLRPEDKLLFWKFHHTLVGTRHALPKVLISMDWTDAKDVTMAETIMSMWPQIGPDDALSLLSSEFENESVRAYAVAALENMSNEDLDLFLLQLVQALRYEPQLQYERDAESPLLQFLLRRCSMDSHLANWFYYFLYTCSDSTKSKSVYTRVIDQLFQQFGGTEDGHEIQLMLSIQNQYVTKVLETGRTIMREGGKAQKKLDRLKQILSSPNSDLQLSEPIVLPLRPEKMATRLTDYVHVFKSAMSPFVLEFVVDEPEDDKIDDSASVASGSKSKKEGITLLENISSMIDSDGKEPCAGKCGLTFKTCKCGVCEECGTLLGATERHHCRRCRYAVCSNCWVKEEGELKKMCKSVDHCLRRRGKTVMVMFKAGDDVRQDQLVIQMIRLMDQLMKRMNLDLHLTPYRVLALSRDEGMLEMVQNCIPLAKVKSIQAYLRERNFQSGAEYEIRSSVLDVYTKSFAGYCVITYLLGIGDRHLDNIMLTHDGHLFHIDFGYIFGADPKAMWNPPQIRISPDMIDGFGGPNSENFSKFLNYCYQSYNILRKNANLITNLTRLMLDSGIKDASEKSIGEMIGKFRLNMTDEEAEIEFGKVLDSCLHSVMPGVLEFAHKIRTAAR